MQRPRPQIDIPVNFVAWAKGQTFAEEKNGREQRRGLGTIPTLMTSRAACCMCNTRDKSSRVHRGLYVCKHCGAVMNADVNGAINILTRYLPGEIHAPWSSGCLAQPAVNRFAWRKTRPSISAHKPWQPSLPLPRTESVVALSIMSA